MAAYWGNCNGDQKEADEQNGRERRRKERKNERRDAEQQEYMKYRRMGYTAQSSMELAAPQSTQNESSRANNLDENQTNRLTKPNGNNNQPSVEYYYESGNSYKM